VKILTRLLLAASLFGQTIDSAAATTWYQDDKQIRPAGSIKAGARDLRQWMRLQLPDGTDGTVDGKRLVSRKNLMETHTTQIVVQVTKADQMFAAYGMGWRISDYRRRLLVSYRRLGAGFPRVFRGVCEEAGTTAG